MKILAIDDSNVNLLVMKGTLEKHLSDAQLKTACSGKEGLDLARSWHPDTILLDLQMPDMDGYETIRCLKQNPATAYIPVIVITAADVDSKDRVRALDLGADAFLQKPISSHELVAHIKVMLRIKKAEERLRHSQKLEAIGILAGGVAHDFNNILTVIRGYSTMLLMQTPPEDPNHESLQMIVDAAKRATSLTQSLLTFSRKQEATPSKAELCTLVSSFEKFLRRIIGDNITLNFVCDQNTSHASVDRSMIEQMLMNLAINARDAMPDGGQLTIATAHILLDSKSASALELSPGTYIHLTVSDTGCGIPRELLPKIFDPFFTTKEVGKGSGLGLSMVYGIVKQHCGTISVESAPGSGTTFSIYLPANETSETVQESQ
ncbi:ATP-binding protein [Trichlorobacter lovleyi]|uniref:histidine kinase n=1 Tax=Trichlorobacter lovleyi (strain ATCC BAA-1151 / DSM 17278 / SZ) TaxID=398767 RepID=B3EB66_TRIL1|nr:ATP-binding protein [Trichlorobacter lovleyi]ACD95460.1 response regulator receiver sensor signal transduction histidine kinase [Trichlorobacter lovleyi SZ]